MSAREEPAPRTVELTIDTSRFRTTITGILQRLDSINRALDRRAAQARRDRANQPVSAERREIQAIGRREMSEAIAEFKARNGVAG